MSIALDSNNDRAGRIIIAPGGMINIGANIAYSIKSMPISEFDFIWGTRPRPPLMIRLAIDGQQVAEVPVQQLIGETTLVENYVFPEGEHVLTVTVDPDNQWQEPDENNNTATYRVRAVAQPNPGQ